MQYHINAHHCIARNKIVNGKLFNSTAHTNVTINDPRYTHVATNRVP